MSEEKKPKEDMSTEIITFILGVAAVVFMLYTLFKQMKDYRSLRELIRAIRVDEEQASLFIRLREELNDCRCYTLDMDECNKLGIDIGSRMSGILAMYLELKKNEKANS